MIPGFENIVEQRIREAQQAGEFNNLEGAGKPLNHDMFARVPKDLRLAYKILKNADCLPPEIELKKEIERTENLLMGIRDVRQKYKALKKLNFLIMKLNTISKRPVAFEVPQKYEQAIVDKISTSS